MQKKVNITFLDVVMFLMIWVFFSLNASFINFSAFTLLRWFFPLFFIAYAFVRTNAYLAYPPAFLWFFMIAVLPSIVLGVAPTTSFLKFLSFLLVFYSAYYFLSNSNKGMLEKSFQSLAIVAIIYQVLNTVMLFTSQGYRSGRGVGMTTNANTLGIYANIAFWMIVYFLKNAQKKGWKAVLLLLMFTTFFCVIVCASRTALVVLALNIVLYLFITFKHSLWLYLIVLLLAVVVVLLLTGRLTFLGITALDRFFDEGLTRDSLWEKGIEVFKEYPVFGCGYTVSNLLNDIANEEGRAFHNSFLSFLAECGIWGVVFMLIGIATLFEKLVVFFKRKENRKISSMPCIVLIVLINLLIAAWSESFLFAVGSTEGFVFWFLLCWLLVYTKKQERGDIANEEVFLRSMYDGK